MCGANKISPSSGVVGFVHRGLGSGGEANLKEVEGHFRNIPENFLEGVSSK